MISENMTRYDRLPTERTLPASRRLDQLSTASLLGLMSREDLRAVRAVARQRRQIARAVDRITASLRRGGRLLLAGAGTSGRLAVLEAAECPPTFSTPPSQIQALIAGGRSAVFRSREGAEDRRGEARALVRARVRRGDVVVGIAASGRTAFVAETLAAAARRGASTILITGDARSPIPAQIRIPLAAGPEILTGSTRLKMGTATKLVLNMLTLGSMARLGKTHGNLMVDVRPTSRKLRARALTIIRTLARCSGAEAASALRRARGQVKPAILIAAKRLTLRQAKRILSDADGSLRQALANH
jgi:N-acetylmuramic acid 6-phosphate etherase